MARHQKFPPQWVLAYEKNGYLVDYLRHPDFIFEDPAQAVERREEAYLLLCKVVPSIKASEIHVAPLRDF